MLPSRITQPYPTDLPDSPPSRQRLLDRAATSRSAAARCAASWPARASKRFLASANPQPRVAFFGEAPGADEDRQGEPFVGRAGQLLTKIIEACGWQRSDVYILNVLKCRPPENRNPLPHEVDNCRPFFERQFEILRPEYIVCVGTVPAQALLETAESVGKLRGRFHRYRDSKVLVTYHPSYLLRNPAAKKYVWDDMQMLLKEMGIADSQPRGVGQISNLSEESGSRSSLEHSAPLQQRDQFLNTRLGIQLVGIEHQIRCCRRFVGAADAGDGDFAAVGQFVVAVGIALAADFERAVEMDDQEPLAADCPAAFCRTASSGATNAARTMIPASLNSLADLGAAAEVLAAVVGREAQVVADAAAHVLAVEHDDGPAHVEQLPLQGIGHRRLAAAGQAGEQHRGRLLAEAGLRARRP